MGYFQDLGLLFFLGMLSLTYIPVSAVFVACLLGAVILCCCHQFVYQKFVRLALLIVYFVASIFLPECLFFLPVIIYLFLQEHCYWGAGVMTFYLVAYLIYSQSSLFPLLIYGVFSPLLAGLLFHRTSTIRRLKDSLYQLRDDSAEANLLLNEKNQHLIEKQNYEIYAATLRERNRIAREIHDNVGHVLSRSILMIGAMKTVQPDSPLAPMIENLDTSLNSAMDSIRNSVHDLHDDSVNLQETVQLLIKDFSFCPVQLDYDMSAEVPRNVKYCFISIIKEALANIMKHSNATSVRILLREHPALYQLCIEDNGKNALIPADTSGIGIQNMRDRIEALHGHIQITNTNGFRIFITIAKES